jgi:transcription antitermination factor NusG
MHFESNALQWHALLVFSRSERKVSAALIQKGFQAFVPCTSERRQWSDRFKIVEFPIFPGFVFCRFSYADRVRVLSTEGISSSFKVEWTPLIVADADIERLERISTSKWEACLLHDTSLQGENAEVIDQEILQGVVLKDGPICQIGIALVSLGKVVRINVPRNLLRIGRSRAASAGQTTR